MAKAKSKAKAKAPQHAAATDTTRAVDDFLATLAHPFKAEIGTLRAAVIAADPSIRDGIKWNAPSFRTREYFATTNLRAKTGVGIILHLGAKVRALPAGGVKIADPGKILRWLGKDRAQVEFGTAADIKAKTPGFQAILRQWIRYV